MAKQRVMQTPPSLIGRTPTQAQKLGNVANKFGVGGVEKQQGSTVNLFDTLLLQTNATQRVTLNFFASTANKSRNFSNWQSQTLNTGETLMMQRVQFYLVKLSAADLNDDATQVQEIIPLSLVLPAVVSNPGALVGGMMSLKIANVTTLKDYLTNELRPEFNAQTTGIATIDNSTETNITTHDFRSTGYSAIQLEAPPVLLMNQKFQISLEIPPPGTVAANYGIVCVVGRFGTLFSPKGTL